MVASTPSKVQGFRGRRALLALALCAIIAGAAYWFWDWFQLDRKFHRAQDALTRHEFIEAKTLFEECAAAKPNDGEVYFFLARTARRADAVGEANRQLSRAEQIGDIPELAQLERKLLQFQVGQGRQHEKALWQLVDNDHADATVILEALGKGYREQFSLSQALHCFKLIVDQAPDHYPAWALRGQVFERLNMNADAVECYTHALALAPNHPTLAPTLHLHMARLLLKQNQPGEVLAHLDQLPPAQQLAPPANLFRVQAHLELGHTQEARELLEQTGLDPHKDALAAYLQGQSLLLEARHAQAEKWFRTALALGPGAPRPMHGLVQCLNVLGKDKEAAQWVAEIDKVNQRTQRIKTLTQEIIAHPDRPDPRCQLGELTLNEMNNELDGPAWLHSALELDPRHERAHRLLADYYRRKGNLPAAQEHEQALKK